MFASRRVICCVADSPLEPFERSNSNCFWWRIFQTKQKKSSSSIWSLSCVWKFEERPFTVYVSWSHTHTHWQPTHLILFYINGRLKLTLLSLYLLKWSFAIFSPYLSLSLSLHLLLEHRPQLIGSDGCCRNSIYQTTHFRIHHMSPKSLARAKPFSGLPRSESHEVTRQCPKDYSHYAHTAFHLFHCRILRYFLSLPGFTLSFDGRKTVTESFGLKRLQLSAKQNDSAFLPAIPSPYWCRTILSQTFLKVLFQIQSIFKYFSFNSFGNHFHWSTCFSSHNSQWNSHSVTCIA